MAAADRFQPAWNFLGLPEDLSSAATARAWVLPVPYEATTSYGAGTRNGPAAILTASRQVEWFDREFDSEPVTRFGIHTLPPLALIHTSPDAMVRHIADTVSDIFAGSPRPDVLAVLGGEHSLSAGVVQGLARAFPGDDLVAVQIDAHADLRESYEGSPHSHACAAHRILETCPVFQIGIRNISEAEERFRRGQPRLHTVFAEDARKGQGFLRSLARFVCGKSVYLTVDVDGLDPSIMPAVGTPEPGGLSWDLMLEIVRVICREAGPFRVFDVVELAPIPGLTAPDFLCAKLVYKLLSLACCRRVPRGTHRIPQGGRRKPA